MIVPPSTRPEDPALRTLKAMVFALAGVILMVAAGFEATSTREFLARAHRAPGEVTLLLAGGAHPQVRFVTDTGRTVEYAQNGMIGGYRPGDRVTVLYDPRDPARDPVVNTIGALWGFNVMNFLLGAGFVLAARQIHRSGPPAPGRMCAPPPPPRPS